MDNFSLSDVAAVTRGDNNGMFGCGGGGMWIFALLILLLIGNGGLFGGNGERAATSADVQRATDFAALERQNNEIVAAVRQSAYDTTGAVKDGQYNILGELRDLQMTTAGGFAELQKCCCEQLRAIDNVNYNQAINTASINANTTAQVQKVLDAITQNRFAQMQDEINQLRTAQAMCGVPRINPYGYQIIPQFGCYNNGGNI